MKQGFYLSPDGLEIVEIKPMYGSSFGEALYGVSSGKNCWLEYFSHKLKKIFDSWIYLGE